MNKSGLEKLLKAIESIDVEDESLEKHDRQYHGGNFNPETMSCLRRMKAAGLDPADLIESEEGKKTARAYEKARKVGGVPKEGDQISRGSLHGLVDGRYQNKELAKAIFETGRNGKELLSSHGFKVGKLYEYLSGKESSVTNDERNRPTWNTEAQRLAAILEKKPEDIFVKDAEKYGLGSTKGADFGQRDRQSGVTEHIEGKDTQLGLKQVMQGLTDKEREIVDLRFGLTSGYSHTLEEVAERYKVGKVRIKQIEQRALERLRHPSRAHKLRALLEQIKDSDSRREPAKQIFVKKETTVDDSAKGLRGIALDAISECEKEEY